MRYLRCGRSLHLGELSLSSPDLQGGLPDRVVCQGNRRCEHHGANRIDTQDRQLDRHRRDHDAQE